MQSFDERAIRALVVVNLALQLYDGLATYAGLNAGFAEANPLLKWAFGHLGPASTLFLFKMQACACLLLLWRVRANRLTAPALALCAAIYTVCSLAPWTAALASLHIDLYITS